ALLLYVFLIWYRDWTGKNMFIYRLLMLPSARIQIFLSKLCAILLMTLGLLAIQALLLPFEKAWFHLRIPEVFITPEYDAAHTGGANLLQLLLPYRFVPFLLAYSVGAIAVMVIFTAILLERSYRLKGVLAGVAYCALCLLVFLSPLSVTEGWLYPLERFLLLAAAGLVVAGCSLMLSLFLIRKKVTV
ncbi:MAG TPA: hypothetical protein VF260_11420, partial [Bacilli bacterium]